MGNKKKVYTIASSHLDTIWSWDFETTVSKYIYDTLVDNFALFKKYPSYTFSFEGSYRYELMEEYYPELFEELKEYIKQGRWNVCGSAYENGDTNCPSPEALFRNILFGNSYFDEKFGKRSADIFLPDCFGFGWALPSIAHHANLKGFTTQKLAWGSAYGIPFDLGKWYGPDGEYIYANCNPHDYYFTLTKLRNWDFVQNKLKENEKYGLDMTCVFHGIGDRGGAPEEKSVRFVENEISKNGESDIEVIAASADEIFYDIDKLPQEVRDNLPKWKTELVMQNHGVGGYTSRAIGKRWNSKCQELGDMAERAGIAASYFGTSKYNEAVLEKAWKRAIAHQFHDDTPGTSVQRAYKRSWNDYAMSINQFSGELEASLASLSSLMKSDFCTGIPVVVSNSVEADRTDLVTLLLENVNAPFVRVYNDKGREVKSQVNSVENGVMEVVFLAEVKSLGMRVYDVRPSNEPCRVKSAISIDDNVMENQKYIVRLNRNGDIQSILDKEDGERELLQKPVVLGLFNYTGSKTWPAWEMNFKEANKEADRIPSCVTVKIRENGPARVAFEVIQKDGKSTFTTVISLADSGETVDVYKEIEWQSMRTMCKNRFALTAKNSKATFDIGLGAIQRENMNEKLFEVPAQKWADITDESGEFGISVLSDSKHGWDKFNDNTLRLTAIHTPKRNYRIDSMQSMMDLGLNRFSFRIFSHKGDVGKATQLQARFFTQPLVAVEFEKHQGVLGTDYSFGGVSDNGVIVRAIKMPHHNAESGEVIVRFNEGENKVNDRFEFSLGEGIEKARELYASEEYKGEAVVENGRLVTSFKPYEVKTFALTLKKPSVQGKKPVSSHINLNYDDSLTHIPDRLLPEKILADGIEFKIDKNAFMTCAGQRLEVKEGKALKLLMTSLCDDIEEKFIVGGKEKWVKINACDEPYAQWDLYDFGETAYVKGGKLGYEFTHSIDEKGNTQFAKGMYFWIVSFEETVELPSHPDLVILSAAEVDMPKASLVTPLEERVPRREFTFKMSLKEKLWYIHSKCVWMLHDRDNFISHNNNGKNGKRIEQTRKNIKSRTIDTVGH
ncbi:MAG: glycoside hydrolase family 38 C-terminal domain-containing protein [Eubacterium sp.]